MNDSKQAGKNSDRQSRKEQTASVINQPVGNPAGLEEPWIPSTSETTAFRFKKTAARQPARKRAVRSLDFPWGWSED